ncbi:MAG: nucleotidyltransferase family protein [Hyellaceae cyanobacterium CSU_1_1]|nr:nucleotidyltransferase family protein [Hyellaceae cyanobacterium CSU_1_1]
MHEIKNIAIDLQWSLTEKRKSKYFPIDLYNLKNNLTYINIGGRKISQLSNEDMFLFLCFHGSKHCWQSLRWICDVAEFIQAHPNLDWQKIETQATELKSQTMLWLTLFLVSDLLATPLPNDLLLKMQTKHRAYLLAQKVYELIFSRNFTQGEDYLFIFRITDSWQGKYLFVTSLLFTPTGKEWKFFKLPNSLTFLYYFIRPFRLIKEYLGASHFSVK